MLINDVCFRYNNLNIYEKFYLTALTALVTGGPVPSLKLEATVNHHQSKRRMYASKKLHIFNFYS